MDDKKKQLKAGFFDPLMIPKLTTKKLLGDMEKNTKTWMMMNLRKSSNRIRERK
jgi:hypothetical protein